MEGPDYGKCLSGSGNRAPETARAREAGAARAHALEVAPGKEPGVVLSYALPLDVTVPVTLEVRLLRLARLV